MDSFTLITIVVVAIVLLVVGGVLGWIFAGRQRTKHLRRQFGTEYDRLVRERGTKCEVENELEARQKRVESLDIHPLSAEESDRFIEEWQSIQAQFVDQPIAAAREADHLITEVMRRRGYPITDFEQYAADLSVDHANVVSNYRASRAIIQKNGQHEANTEELRQAMIHYRALFAELVGAKEMERKEIIPAR